MKNHLNQKELYVKLITKYNEHASGLYDLCVLLTKLDNKPAAERRWAQYVEATERALEYKLRLRGIIQPWEEKKYADILK